MDRQVKVRGQRLDLEEVEEWLRRHPGVSEAAVYLVSRDMDRPVLEAAAIPVPGENLLGRDLRRYLAERLPPAAVPERVEISVDFPRTGSDKIDRRALASRRKGEWRIDRGDRN